MVQNNEYKGNLENNLYTEDIDDINGETIYSIKVNDRHLIGRYSTDIYIHGRCHLFALVAQELTGKPLHIFCKPDYHSPQKEGDLSKGILLSHAYIDIGNGYSWDAKGLSKTEELKEQFSSFEENIYELSDVSLDTNTNAKENTERIQAMMRKGYIAKFSQGEEQSLRLYIQEMINLECNKTHTENSDVLKKIDNNTQNNTNNPGLRF